MRANLRKNGAAMTNAFKVRVIAFRLYMSYFREADRQKRLLSRSHSWANKWIVNLGTLPYYRFFRQNTLLPILNIVEAKRKAVSERELARLLTNWRQRKIDELRFIQAAVSSKLLIWIDH
jgi:hypothetical protein